MLAHEKERGNERNREKDKEEDRIEEERSVDLDRVVRERRGGEGWKKELVSMRSRWPVEEDCA